MHATTTKSPRRRSCSFLVSSSSPSLPFAAFSRASASNSSFSSNASSRRSSARYSSSVGMSICHRKKFFIQCGPSSFPMNSLYSPRNHTQKHAALETNVENHPRREKLLPGVHVAAERAVRLERDTHHQRVATSHLDAVLGADLASHDGRGPIHQPARQKKRRRPIPRTRCVKRVATSLHQLAYVTRHQSLHHSLRVRPVGYARRQWIMREPRDDGDVVDHRPIIRPVAGLYRATPATSTPKPQPRAGRTSTGVRRSGRRPM